MYGGNTDSTVFVVCYRYEDTGDAVAGHAAYAGQRAAVVFLCVLHLRHHRSTAVGRHTTPEVFPEAHTQRHLPQVSTAHTHLHTTVCHSSSGL